MAEVIAGRGRSDFASERQQIEDVATRFPTVPTTALARELSGNGFGGIKVNRTYFSVLSVIRRFRAKQNAAAALVGA